MPPAEQGAHTVLHGAPPNCFNCLTVAKGKDAYLGVTGEDDLLDMPVGKSHLFRGDPGLTLGMEVVVLGPLFIFSVCRGHRIGQPWPTINTTSPISKNTPMEAAHSFLSERST